MYPCQSNLRLLKRYNPQLQAIRPVRSMTSQKTIPGAMDRSISTAPSSAMAMVTYQRSMKSPHLVIPYPFDLFRQTAQTLENQFIKVQDYEIIRQTKQIQTFFVGGGRNSRKHSCLLSLPRTFFATIIVYKGMVDETVHGRMCFPRM